MLKSNSGPVFAFVCLLLIEAVPCCFGQGITAAENNTSQRRIAEETVLFQKLRNGVVTIEGELGSGSGFIADAAGIVLTNAHVIRGSREVRVEFAPDRKVRAEILSVDARKDVAALWVNLEGFQEFVVLPLAKAGADSAPVTEGEKVLAIGSPLSQRK